MKNTPYIFSLFGLLLLVFADSAIAGPNVTSVPDGKLIPPNKVSMLAGHLEFDAASSWKILFLFERDGSISAGYGLGPIGCNLSAAPLSTTPLASREKLAGAKLQTYANDAAYRGELNLYKYQQKESDNITPISKSVSNGVTVYSWESHEARGKKRYWKHKSMAVVIGNEAFLIGKECGSGTPLIDEEIKRVTAVAQP